MNLQLIKGTDLDQDLQSRCHVAAYVAALACAKKPLVDNVWAEYYYLRWHGQAFPIVVVNEYHHQQSYVASLFNTYILYAIEELHLVKLPKCWRWFLEKMIRSVGFFFNQQHMDKVVYVNNWLVSTNLYPKQFAPDDCSSLLSLLTQTFPKHSICFRSLNENLNADLMASLERSGCFRLASRQVYLFDARHDQGASILAHKDSKRDLKLSAKHHSHIQQDAEPSFHHLRLYHRLYEKLYLEKYCQLNPQYSVGWLVLAARTQVIQYHVLYCQDEEVTGVNGVFQVDDVMSVPLFGYDCDSAPKLAYYRQLVAESLSQSIQHALVFHASSGAADFKKNRGATAAIEYSLCYNQHLPKSQRRSLNYLVKIVNGLGVYIMQKFQL